MQKAGDVNTFQINNNFVVGQTKT